MEKCVEEPLQRPQNREKLVEKEEEEKELMKDLVIATRGRLSDMKIRREMYSVGIKIRSGKVLGMECKFKMLSSG